MDIPIPIFAYTALVPWTFFASGLAQSADSLVGSANLLKKVRLSRLAIPIAAVLSGVVDFAIAFVVLLGLMVYFGSTPIAAIVWLPFFVVLALVTALGTGLWLSAMNVKFRDVRYVVPFLIQFWLFATPIAYPSSLLDEPWRTIYGINPMAGVVEGFRWALLGSGNAPGPMVVHVVACRPDAARQRRLLLPANGKDVRRSRLGILDASTEACGLGKQYRLGGARTPYKTLRDSIAAGTSRLFNTVTRRATSKPDDTDACMWALRKCRSS